MSRPDLIAAIEPVIRAFDHLGVSYYIGGSVASSAYGIAGATMDIDTVSNLNRSHAAPLVRMLEESYYISEAMILDAIDHQSSFNIIHLETMLKVDVFIAKETPFHQESLRRRKKDTIDEDDVSIELYLASAEDIILHKLDWFCQLGQESERQWLDILGVIKVQGNQLDQKYLKKWAEELALPDLLKKAFEEADIEIYS